MSAYLDHIGVAIKPGSRLAEVLEILGLPVTSKERVAREKVDTTWIPLPLKPGNVELLEPAEPTSTIQIFLDKTNKDAVHHLSFRVEELDEVSAKLLVAGFNLIYPEPRPGAHGCMVNFIHPKSTGGVLIEITQKK